MSAIDDALDFVEDNNTIGSGVSASAARIELTTLRAAVAERDAAIADYEGLRAMLKCPDDRDLASWIDTLLSNRDAAIEKAVKAERERIADMVLMSNTTIANLAAAIRARNETKE